MNTDAPYPWQQNPDWVPDRMGADRDRIEATMATVKVINDRLDEMARGLARIEAMLALMGLRP